MSKKMGNFLSAYEISIHRDQQDPYYPDRAAMERHRGQLLDWDTMLLAEPRRFRIVDELDMRDVGGISMSCIQRTRSKGRTSRRFVLTPDTDLLAVLKNPPVPKRGFLEIYDVYPWLHKWYWRRGRGPHGNPLPDLAEYEGLFLYHRVFRGHLTKDGYTVQAPQRRRVKALEGV